MPVTVNLRHLEDKNVHLNGEIPPNELELGKPDEMAVAILEALGEQRPQRQADDDQQHDGEQHDAQPHHQVVA